MKSEQSCNQSIINQKIILQDSILSEQLQKICEEFLACQIQQNSSQAKISSAQFPQSQSLNQIQQFYNNNLIQISNKSCEQIKYLKNIINELLKKYNTFKNTVLTLKNIFQQTIFIIHNKISKHYKDFDYFTDFSEQSSINQALNMGKFIYHTTIKLSEQTEKLLKFQQLLKQIRKDNIKLRNNNYKLLHFIGQRKIYSEKLKNKIIQLKQELRKNTDKKNDKNPFAIDQTFKENTADLQYQNKNDLITIIRCLCARILKHNIECNNIINKINTEGVNQLLT